MDVTLVLSAAIFTLLALVVATSLLRGSSPRAPPVENSRPPAQSSRPPAGSSRAPPAAPAAAPAGPRLNGLVPPQRRGDADLWSELSGSGHDHWDVVKSVRSEEDQPRFDTEEATLVEHSTSTGSSLSVPCPGSRHMSLETEGATESLGLNEEKVESDDSSPLRYIPGKARTHHLEMMMSTEELEEEQRVQREQLAAIFQLLKDNKETFGDVSDGDLEEQLRLYSI